MIKSPKLNNNNNNNNNQNHQHHTKHWSQKIHETSISSDLMLKLNLINHIQGGSDSGEFIHFDCDVDVCDTDLISGRIYAKAIILEIEGQKLSGYTLFDVQTWLRQLIQNFKLITLRMVKSSYLPAQLRSYLDERFQKGSVDYDLQQTIRENVYMRTVPCTTRPPRNGEINGQDYIFLSNNDFLELEKNGHLLEYGVYNGHYYGTPKPPKEPSGKSNFSIALPKRNNSISEMKPPLHSSSTSSLLPRPPLPPPQPAEGAHACVQQTPILNGSHHQNNTPTGSSSSSTSSNHKSNADELLPYGWEKVEDSEYGTFYIDHINKQTTYENPLLKQQQQQQIQQVALERPHVEMKKQKQRLFTLNPNELQGDFQKTTLLKTSQGFGFTIIGANETCDDFLQIKYIVPGGAAYTNGILKHGDILVYVNQQCVLGYTHQNVVEMFQSIPIGDYVELTICRGYPLSIDPNDPNIEIKPLPAINNDTDHAHANESDDYQELSVGIVKGPMGFGFTIADDSLNDLQKVKQILDRERCVNLIEGDILLEINGISLINLAHTQVVDILKDCKKGQETIIRLKRFMQTHVAYQQQSSTTSKGDLRPKTPIEQQQQNLRPKTPQNDNYYYLSQQQQQQPMPTATLAPPISKTPLPQSSSSSLIQTNELYSAVNRKSERDLTNLKENVKKVHTQKSATLIDPSQARSKTPGPEMFRDRTNNLPTSTTLNNIYQQQQQQQQQNDQSSSNHQKYYTLNQNFTNQQRSKTPTADMFYTYKQQPQHQHDETHFNGIYHPFMQASASKQPSPRAQPHLDDTSQIQYKYIDIFVELYRQESGFGFRIVGGEEEGSQVAVGYIVPSGAADLDSRLKPNDEIVMIDNENVIGASHKRVVRLMTIAGLNRKVKLWVKRKVPINVSETSQYPFTITLFRNGHEGFGFVIISAMNRNGPSIGEDASNNLHPHSWIGKIVENSPAERCGRLHVGDRILAVNNIDITIMNHVDIVKLIKESGNSITLTIGSPIDEPLVYSTSGTHISPKLATTYETVIPIKNELVNNYTMLPPQPLVPIQIQSQVPYQQQQHSSSSRSHISSNNSPQHNQFSRQNSHQKMQYTQPPPPTQQQQQQQSESNLYHVIELRKPANTGFGFSIRGGKEFNIPIFILKLADSGPAALDGRLRVGDQILEINGHDAYNMVHSEAIEHIKAGGNTVVLLVRRTGLPPPSITDIIAANQCNASNTRAPSTLPYHQSESTLIHRAKSPYLTQMNDTYSYGQHSHNQQQQYQSQKQFYSSSALRN